MLFAGAVAGLCFPIITTVFLGIYYVARIGYRIGYSRGPLARRPFAPFLIICQNVLPWFAVAACFCLYFRTIEGNKSAHYGFWTSGDSLKLLLDGTK